MPYTYIAKAYGKQFAPGQRVRFTEYQGDRGLGVVRGVRGDPQYVKVEFDSGQVGNCHPGSLEVVCKTCADNPEPTYAGERCGDCKQFL